MSHLTDFALWLMGIEDEPAAENLLFGCIILVLMDKPEINE